MVKLICEWPSVSMTTRGLTPCVSRSKARSVPEVVQADTRQPSVLEEALEHLGEVTGFDRRAAACREYQTCVLPLTAFCQPGLTLAGSVAPQGSQGDSRQGHRAAAPRGLGLDRMDAGLHRPEALAHVGRACSSRGRSAGVLSSCWACLIAESSRVRSATRARLATGSPPVRCRACRTIRVPSLRSTSVHRRPSASPTRRPQLSATVTKASSAWP